MWASCFIHLLLLGQGEKRLCNTTGSLETILDDLDDGTCLPFILFFLILFPFPVFYSLIEQMKVSAALVQNFAVRFLPLLRVSVPGLNPAAAE